MKTKQKIGILLTNSGTPDAFHAKAVRRYLREFLSDKRIIQLPRFIWLPILYGLILPLRPRRTSKLYQEIWTPEGSPMRVFMQQISKLLQNKLNENSNQLSFTVAIGMNYGHPSIQHALETLKDTQVQKFIVLPLFPQYSNTTTASSIDRCLKTFSNWSTYPSFTVINSYADDENYIEALASNIQKTWDQEKRSHLLISFHGIPQRYVQKGDPYNQECEKTAYLLAQHLNLSAEQWNLCYQSQFGYDKWLQPSFQQLTDELPAQGIKEVDVVCPGFAADCLETLEEIAIRGKESFINAGGKRFRFIPSLNAHSEHIEMLANLVNVDGLRCKKTHLIDLQIMQRYYSIPIDDGLHL